MLKIISTCLNFKYHDKKDLTIYRDFIKNYKQYGNNIEPIIFVQLLKKSNATFLRKQIISQDFKHIFKQCIPLIDKKWNFLVQHNVITNLALNYLTLNIHKKAFFDILQQKYHTYENKLNMRGAIYLFKCIVELNHMSNPQLKQKIKQKIIFFSKKSLKDQGSIQKTFYIYLQALKFILMDPEFKKQDIFSILEIIQGKIIPQIDQIQLNQKQFLSKNLRTTSEFLKIHKIQTKNTKLKQIFNASFKLKEKSVNKNGYFQYVESIRLDFSSSNPINNIYKRTSRADYIIDGGGSIFEKMFRKVLNYNGYNFKSNVIIGNFEYDFIITGKLIQDVKPFSNFNPSDLFKMIQPINPQRWSKKQNVDNIFKRSVNEQWIEPVVLNLHGPQHYITSDQYGDKKTTRTDQLKGLILKEYGYKKYNVVHYNQWEKVNIKSFGASSYLQKLLSINQLNSTKNSEFIKKNQINSQSL